MGINQEILTWIGTTASVIAAAVAIFLLIWTVTRDLRDKGRLRIEFAPVWNKSAINAGNINDAVIPCCRITNVGTQQITAQRMWLEFDNFPGQMGWDYKNLPRMLQPSEWVMEPMDVKVVRDGLSAILVIDSHGKTWRAATAEVQRIKDWCIASSADETSLG